MFAAGYLEQFASGGNCNAEFMRIGILSVSVGLHILHDGQIPRHVVEQLCLRIDQDVAPALALKGLSATNVGQKILVGGTGSKIVLVILDVLDQLVLV